MGSSRYVESGMFFAVHCDPHDSSPPLGLGCQSPQRWKYPTHRSKSWEELAKRRASQRRPSHQARRKSKAGENSLRAGWALLFFCPQPHGCCAAHRHSVTVQGRYFSARRTSLSSLGLRRPEPRRASRYFPDARNRHGKGGANRGDLNRVRQQKTNATSDIAGASNPAPAFKEATCVLLFWLQPP